MGARKSTFGLSVALRWSGGSRRSTNPIVDRKIRLDICRMLVCCIGWLKERGQDARQKADRAAGAKLVELEENSRGPNRKMEKLLKIANPGSRKPTRRLSG